MRRNPTDALARLFAANSFWIALCMIVDHLASEMNSAMLAHSLNAPGLRVGPGCRIIGGRHIQFGRGIYANRNLWLEAVTFYKSQRFSPAISIGDHVSFSDGVHISAIDKIVIGNHVLMGSHVYISDHNHGIYRGSPQSHPEEGPSDRPLGGGGQVIIGDRVFIGDNSVLVGPVTIGNGAIIGANSVVRGAVESNSMMAGTPARMIKLFNPQTGIWERV